MANRSKVITFASRKGGVGKSTCVALLARYYAEVEGRKVIIIDLDARGGATYLLTHVDLGKEDLSISEVIQVASNQGNFQDVFNQAVIDTGLSKNKNWVDNGGRLFLLPSKPNLDTVLASTHHSLLGSVIRNISLPDDVLILIDPGSNSDSVLSGVSAADVVFLPLLMSQLDVKPVFETLRTILRAQRESENNKPILGGFIFNQPRPTKWTEEYIKQYSLVLEEYRNDSGMRCASEDIFLFLNDSSLLARNAQLELPFRKDFYTFTKKLADIVHQV